MAELKRASRKKKKNYSFRLFFLFLIVVFACIAFMHSSYFAITKISVEGNKYLTAAQIMDLSRIKEGMNIFSLKTNEITNSIKTNCWVEDVQLVRELPTKVVIKVEERTPLVTIPIQQRFINLDKQGVVLSNDISCQENLPLITGLNISSRLNPGQVIQSKELLYVLKGLNMLDSNALARISEVNLQQKDNLLIYMLDGMEIRLGGFNDLVKKINLLIPILQDSQIKNSSIEYIDMRFNKPVIKWRM